MDNKIIATFLDAETIACPLVKPQRVTDWTIYEQTTPEQTAEHIKGCNIVFTNKVKIGPAELNTAPELRLIVVAATGYDIIDLDACRRHDVAVANSPGYSASSVQEHTIALMFAVARNIVPLRRAACDGTWSSATTFCLHTHAIIELAGKTLGIIGSGSLGCATAKLCEALGMKVVFATRHTGQQDDLPRIDLDKLLSTSDIISLHCPLDAANHHMINAAALAKMKPQAILINTARGGLVDPVALCAALEAGTIAGAGIDVLEQEPPPADHPLLTCKHPGLIVTPHVAWASMEVQIRLAQMVADTADSYLTGTPVHLVS